MRLIFMASLAALAVLSGPAVGSDFKPIDCGSTSFAFSDSAYLVDCERAESPLRVGSSSGKSVTDVINVTNDDRTIFLTVVSRTITAPRIYMEYRGLGESFRDVFNEPDVKNWESRGNKDGFDVAEFDREISGRDSHCITVQRYTNAMHTGFKRHVIGMGCSVDNLEAVYQLLGKLDAPG